MKSFKKIAIAFGSLALGVGAVGVSAVSLQNKAVQANATSGSWVAATSITSGKYYLIVGTFNASTTYMTPTGSTVSGVKLTGTVVPASLSTLDYTAGWKFTASGTSWTLSDCKGSSELFLSYKYDSDGGFSTSASFTVTTSNDNKFALAHSGSTWSMTQAGSNSSKTMRPVYCGGSSWGMKTGSGSAVLTLYEYVNTPASLAISGDATKTTYLSGAAFDPTGLIVTATYSDNSTATIANSLCTWSPATISAAGDISVTATYAGVTSSVKTVSVTLLTVNSLEISGTLSKTIYTSGETFDPTGLTVTATYSDSSTGVIANSDCTWAPTTVTAAATSITATYGGVTSAAFAVSITLKAPASIASSGTLTKTAYLVGDAFNPAGLTFTVTYDNGTTAVVAGSSITWGTLAAGDTSITGTYTEGGTSVEVIVNGITVTASSLAKTDEFAGATTLFPTATVGSTAYSKAAVVNGDRWALTATGTAFGIGQYTGKDYLNIRQNNSDCVANLHSCVFPGYKINRIVLDYYWNSTNSTVNVTTTVGGQTFGTVTTQFDPATSGAEFTADFTYPAGAYGAINLKFASWAGASKTIFIKSVAVYGIADTTSDAAKAATFASKVELADGCVANSALVSEYNSLDSTVKALADAYTIDDWADGATAKTAQTVVIGRCTVAQKMAAIVAITGSGSGTSLMIKNSDSSTYILAGLAGLACITIGGLFFLRKKKENA